VKWNVGNEVKIGIFAIKEIKKGNEITFDYDFDAYGTQLQVCHCGSKNCRGTITKKKSETSTVNTPTPVEQLEAKLRQNIMQTIKIIENLNDFDNIQNTTKNSNFPTSIV
jgi:hypothetical protein